MGLMQRQKGARVERELVQKLRLLGLDAKRIPLSGATEYAKYDVEVKFTNGVKCSIEVKSRKDGFKKIYELAEKHPGASFLEGSTAEALLLDSFTPLISHQFPSLQVVKAPASLSTLMKLKGGADILAIKANNKPFLFLIDANTVS